LAELDLSPFLLGVGMEERHAPFERGVAKA
jgi:hypothetical protein